MSAVSADAISAGTAPENGPADDDGAGGGTSLVEQAPRLKVRSIFRRFWPETRPFRGRMVLSLLLAAISPALATVSVWLFKILVDDVLTPHDYRLFPAVAAAYLGITLLEGLLNFTDQYMSVWVGERFVLSLRVRLFAHIQRLSLGYFERNQLGDILSRLTGDVGAIESLVLTGVNVALSYTFQIAFFTAAMFYLNWQLALAAFVAAPGFLLLARVFSRRIKDASRERRRRSGSITAVAEESLGNVALVQAYDREEHEVDRFQEENLGSFRAQMTATRLEALFSPFSSLLETIGVLLVVGIAVWELANNRITLGGLLVFVAYLTQLYGPISGFGNLWNSLYSASASAERIIEVLDEEPGVVEPEVPRTLARASGEVRFEDVEFSYPGTDKAVLRGISYQVPPGTKVAIVGASGAGKTTLTKLMLRFYDPANGRITLDGRDLRDLSLSDLRRNVTAVLQETLVFDGTVADNIRYGKPDATDQEITAAAVAADAHGFISALPEGYDTRIGQRGRMLSGGQRQRLAIARAMIRDSPVLLLDEPTTGLDAESTQRVLEPMRRLMSGRTTIVISHNLLTVTDADQILFLDGGVITGMGTHQQLLGRHPGYTRLYQLHHPDQPSQPVGPIAAGAASGRAPVGPPANAPTTSFPVARPRWAAADSTSATTRFARILPARPVKTLGRDYPPPAAPSRTAGTPAGRDTTATTSRLPVVPSAGWSNGPRPTPGRHRAAAENPPQSAPAPRIRADHRPRSTFDRLPTPQPRTLPPQPAVLPPRTEYRQPPAQRDRSDASFPGRPVTPPSPRHRHETGPPNGHHRGHTGETPVPHHGEVARTGLRR
ncbi:ABC transporter transmembrane domain-containing protein [Pseudonocardia sp. CA-142604]|uniref:ABC transporter ATP-binding protein n=1 Tax=Pseudonocardia sp. CA-142604 TaxID=3240024 RepID=UPI003D937966